MGRSGPIRLWAAAVWLLVWQAGAMALNQPLLLPSPAAALIRLAELAGTASFWRAALWSAGRILGGFFLALAAGVLLAALASGRRWVRELLAPLTAVVKATPVASFIILALVWLNSRQLPLFIAFLMVFPPVYLNVLEGVAQTDRKLLEMARVYRVPLLRQVGGIYLPQVLPYLRSAVSAGWGFCWKAGVAAEVIGLPAGSVGERLYTAKVYFQTADLFAWTAVIVVLSAALERALLRLLDMLAGKAAK